MRSCFLPRSHLAFCFWRKSIPKSPSYSVGKSSFTTYIVWWIFQCSRGIVARILPIVWVLCLVTPVKTMRSSRTDVSSFRFRNFIRVSVAPVSSKKLVLSFFVSCMGRVTKSRLVLVCDFPFISSPCILVLVMMIFSLTFLLLRFLHCYWLRSLSFRFASLFSSSAVECSCLAYRLVRQSP